MARRVREDRRRPHRDFAAAAGRKVVSRTSAEKLGELAHVVVDLNPARVALLVVGRRRKALVVTWANVTGFGPDAVMNADENDLRATVGKSDATAHVASSWRRRSLTSRCS